MQPAFFLLVLIAVSLAVDCAPRLQDPERLVPPQQSNTGARADASAGMRHFYLELSEAKRKGTHRPSLVILPVRRETSNFVSIFDLRRKRFVCMDGEGELFNSKQKNREDCLFQRIWLDFDNDHDVFYSASGARLFTLKAAELRVSHQEPPEPPSPLVQRLLGTLVKRQRRSEEVNPSDPLQTESHPSLSSKDHKDADQRQPEQDQTGAVSKETIASCDDPLRVLQSNGPVSPVKTNIAERAEQD
ncbi:fibroblast growth factor 23-like [Notolabrus celidotus]|uniref:fibroblast growth factor 23-like n=1 Tax=Notolabrus celidotus TaxID=1203425 RepID=UPI00148FD3B6|nr:fibroblast growth factor 23-like [Notolabrus celidotus]